MPKGVQNDKHSVVALDSQVDPRASVPKPFARGLSNPLRDLGKDFRVGSEFSNASFDGISATCYGSNSSIRGLWPYDERRSFSNLQEGRVQSLSRSRNYEMAVQEPNDGPRPVALGHTIQACCYSWTPQCTSIRGLIVATRRYLGYLKG